jgi:hypothetical protein
MLFAKSESNPRLLAHAVRSPWPAALDVTNKVSQTCNGKKTCSIIPSNNWAGIDPKPRFNKYLEINFLCRRTDNNKIIPRKNNTVKVKEYDRLVIDCTQDLDKNGKMAFN